MTSSFLCITFHGSSHKNKYNNIWAYPLGNPLGKKFPLLNTDTLPKDVRLRELRAFQFGPDGKLYVVVANKDNSKILRFTKAATSSPSFDFDVVFTKNELGEPFDLEHPFQMAFDPTGNLYVSSQNSNRVYRFYGPATSQAGFPMPVPAIYAGLDLPTGIFIPALKDAELLDMPIHQGFLKKVRGIGFGPDGNLYVADEKIPAVNRYHGQTGVFLKTLIGAKHFLKNYTFIPNHLLLEGNQIFVADRDNNCVYQMDIINDTPFGLLIDRSHKQHTHSGGLHITTMNGQKTIIWGQRKDNHKSRVVAYSTDGSEVDKSQTVLKKLKDEPEFIQIFIM